MKLLALEHELPAAAAADFKRYARAEARRAWELYQSGLIRELYFHRDDHTAILVLECEDLEQARQALSSLPLAAHGLITFEIIPLVPYNGFERLFAA